MKAPSVQNARHVGPRVNNVMCINLAKKVAGLNLGWVEDFFSHTYYFAHILLYIIISSLLNPVQVGLAFSTLTSLMVNTWEVAGSIFFRKKSSPRSWTHMAACLQCIYYFVWYVRHQCSTLYSVYSGRMLRYEVDKF